VIETLVVICIGVIFMALLLPALSHAKRAVKRQNERRVEAESYDKFNIGDTVIVRGINVTGVVETTYAFGTYEVIVNGEKGVQKMTIKAPLLKLAN
jgi:hypothetical protein